MTSDDYAFKVAGSTDVLWLRQEVRWWRERCQRTDEFYGQAYEQWLAAMRALVFARDKGGSGAKPMSKLDPEIDALRERLMQFDAFTQERS